MSYTFKTDTSELFRWIRDEIEFPGTISRGKRGMDARRVQEWLTLCGLPLVPDGIFGVVTEMTVAQFQKFNGFNETGVVNEATWDMLVRRMRELLRVGTDLPDSPLEAMKVIAKRHLDLHPVEIGGQNAGPWVRLYMKGNEGDSWPWCAGFVSFVMEQAYELLDRSPPMDGSFSCDWFAATAKAKSFFVPESAANPDTVPPGSFFLVRRTSTDWTHMGIVSAAEDQLFHTIEGNTNDEGSREGYEVCARRRGYASKDFIVLRD